MYHMAELTPFTIYVRPELLAALKAAAEGEGRSLSNYIARVLETHQVGGYSVVKLTEAPT